MLYANSIFPSSEYRLQIINVKIKARGEHNLAIILYIISNIVIQQELLRQGIAH